MFFIRVPSGLTLCDRALPTDFSHTTFTSHSGERRASAAGPPGTGRDFYALQFVGCGDAFGTGGRFNTCFHLVGREINALIDCGATSLVGLNKLAIDRNDINHIFISHFHADHIAGLPFFILEANYVLKRQHGLTIAGPPGLKSRYAEIMDTAFRGTEALELSFPLTLQELEVGRKTRSATCG